MLFAFLFFVCYYIKQFYGGFMDNIALEKVLEIIEKQVNFGKILLEGESFSKYQKIFMSTNENIKDSLNLIEFENKHNALSVMASGDHSFNLINKNILNIDTFDTNMLTEYYVLGIKRSMIVKYKYQEYIEKYKLFTNMNASLENITGTLYDLLPLMDVKYRLFWKKIIEFNYKIQKDKQNKINLFYMLFINLNHIDFIINNNNYLSNENEYNILKNNITKSNIKFNNVNATNLGEFYKNSRYDVVLLSNILDYFGKEYKNSKKVFNYEELLKYEDSIFNIMNKDGILFLKYIINFSKNNFVRNNVFMDSFIKTSEFTRESIHKVPNGSLDDGMILVKKLD